MTKLASPTQHQRLDQTFPVFENRVKRTTDEYDFFVPGKSGGHAERKSAASFTALGMRSLSSGRHHCSRFTEERDEN